MTDAPGPDTSIDPGLEVGPGEGLHDQAYWDSLAESEGDTSGVDLGSVIDDDGEVVEGVARDIGDIGLTAGSVLGTLSREGELRAHRAGDDPAGELEPDADDAEADAAVPDEPAPEPEPEIELTPDEQLGSIQDDFDHDHAASRFGEFAGRTYKALPPDSILATLPEELQEKYFVRAQELAFNSFVEGDIDAAIQWLTMEDITPGELSGTKGAKRTDFSDEDREAFEAYLKDLNQHQEDEKTLEILNSTSPESEFMLAIINDPEFMASMRFKFMQYRQAMGIVAEFRNIRNGVVLAESRKDVVRAQKQMEKDGERDQNLMDATLDMFAATTIAEMARVQRNPGLVEMAQSIREKQEAKDDERDPALDRVLGQFKQLVMMDDLSFAQHFAAKEGTESAAPVEALDRFAEMSDEEVEAIIKEAQDAMADPEKLVAHWFEGYQVAKRMRSAWKKNPEERGSVTEDQNNKLASQEGKSRAELSFREANPDLDELIRSGRTATNEELSASLAALTEDLDSVLGKEFYGVNGFKAYLEKDVAAKIRERQRTYDADVVAARKFSRPMPEEPTLTLAKLQDAVTDITNSVENFNPNGDVADLTPGAIETVGVRDVEPTRERSLAERLADRRARDAK